MKIQRFFLAIVAILGLTVVAQAAMTVDQRERVRRAFVDKTTGDVVVDAVDLVTGVPATLDFFPATHTTNFVGVAASTCKDSGSITATGAAANDPCIVGLPAAATETLNWTCYVSAADTIKIRVCNPTVAVVLINASRAYKVRAFDAP